MRARKVKGLDPAGTLADNAERIVRTRLDELCAFMPAAAGPDGKEALHDMRIAAKRLRYALELTHHCFGRYARPAGAYAKAVQDVLGELHDCDVQLPELTALLEELAVEDAATLAAAAGDAPDLEPAAVAHASHAADWAGLVALTVHLRARRRVLHARFLELWEEGERKGFRARLEYAVAERAETPDMIPAQP